jgi:hypothetical protein
MRRITTDTKECQKQIDDEGWVYYYRKDYVYRGDKKNEYSLILLFAKRLEQGREFMTLPGIKEGETDGTKIRETTEPVLPVPGGETGVRGPGDVHGEGSPVDLKIESPQL